MFPSDGVAMGGNFQFELVSMKTYLPTTDEEGSPNEFLKGDGRIVQIIPISEPSNIKRVQSLQSEILRKIVEALSPPLH